MYKVKIFIVLDGNKIIKIYHTSGSKDDIKIALENDEVFKYTDIKEVPSDSDYHAETDIREYANNKLRPLVDRIIDGLSKCPDGQKLSEGKLVDKTLKDQIQDKEIIIEEHQMYCEKTDSIIDKPKTKEQLEQEELEDEIQKEMRKIAIERIDARKKINIKK